MASSTSLHPFILTYISHLRSRTPAVSSAQPSAIQISQQDNDKGTYTTLTINADKITDKIHYEAIACAMAAATSGPQEIEKVVIHSNYGSQWQSYISRIIGSEQKLPQSRIQTLTMQNCSKQPILFEQRIMKQLIAGISELLINTRLACLHLIGLSMSPAVLKILTYGLDRSKYLRELSLARTYLGSSGLSAIAKSLKHSCLQRLDLSAAGLTIADSDLLCDIVKYQALKSTTAWWETNLRGNEAKPMHKLRGLARLSIANNLLSDQFVCKLFDTLLEMGTIEALDLQSTGLSPEIVDEVDRFIVNYKNIALIDLRLNEFDAPPPHVRFSSHVELPPLPLSHTFFIKLPPVAPVLKMRKNLVMNEKRPAFKPAGIAGVGMTPQEIRDMQRIERMAQARGLYKSEPMLSQKSESPPMQRPRTAKPRQTPQLYEEGVISPIVSRPISRAIQEEEVSLPPSPLRQYSQSPTIPFERFSLNSSPQDPLVQVLSVLEQSLNKFHSVVDHLERRKEKKRRRQTFDTRLYSQVHSMRSSPQSYYTAEPESRHPVHSMRGSPLRQEDSSEDLRMQIQATEQRIMESRQKVDHLMSEKYRDRPQDVDENNLYSSTSRSDSSSVDQAEQEYNPIRDNNITQSVSPEFHYNTGEPYYVRGRDTEQAEPRYMYDTGYSRSQSQQRSHSRESDYRPRTMPHSVHAMKNAMPDEEWHVRLAGLDAAIERQELVAGRNHLTATDL